MTAKSTLRHKYDLPITDEEIKYRLLELRFYEQAALERASRQALDSHVRCYVTFCRSIRRAPFPLCFETIGLFLVQYCQRFGHTARSIPGILSHLKRANREHGHPPISEADLFRLNDVITGLRKHDKSEPQRKLPITHEVLRAMEGKAFMTKLRHYQHITMCRLAHDALLRGTELINLQVGHLVWNHDRSQVTAYIHQSKANKTGPVELVTLSNYGPSSAVAYLREYVRIMAFHRRPPTTPLWPQVDSNGAVSWDSPTSKDALVALLRILLNEAGYSASKYSGHSFRSGGATDLWASGQCRPHTIQLFGRWKSDAFWLYVRDNPQLRALEIASAFASIHQECRPDLSVLAASALAAFQFGK